DQMKVIKVARFQKILQRKAREVGRGRLQGRDHLPPSSKSTTMIVESNRPAAPAVWRSFNGRAPKKRSSERILRDGVSGRAPANQRGHDADRRDRRAHPERPAEGPHECVDLRRIPGSTTGARQRTAGRGAAERREDRSGERDAETLTD